MLEIDKQMLISALKIIEVAKRPSMTFLSALWGPKAKPLRRDVASVLYETKLPLSSRLVQYNNLRDALVSLAEVPSSCQALEDDAFDVIARALLESSGC